MSRKSRKGSTPDKPADLSAVTEWQLGDVLPPVTVPSEPANVAAPPTNGKADHDRVKPHLRCPVCWKNPAMRGKASRRKWWRQISGSKHERCYTCDQCGCEYVVEVEAQVEDNIEFTATKVTRVKLPTDGAPA
jgi:hypothetical protein